MLVTAQLYNGWPDVLRLPYLALAGGIFFAYSFAGLAWPIAVLWALAFTELD